MLSHFWRDARGATAIEYCVVAALISIVIVGGATAMGTKLSANYYNKVAASFN